MTTSIKLNSTFNFGKYKNQKVQEVANKDPKYIIWNIENNKDLFVEAEVIAFCKSILPDFQLSEKASQRWSNIHRKQYNKAIKFLKEKGRLIDVTPSPFVHVS
ncbi:hypothetical protein [Flammeovirga sp. SJP92]|uniref:exodeoxyribonuclease X C-terminal domain-containing protein n=1 Tax=Flammeovirga sp. SJP92 TaxID=1775430 RepID=UPI000786BFF0|nr:hypothetical protein [Flammeovirga sp. SJP92]KXX70810.1 hypothetical protein AVL50_11545 [Flammeovirga sp. SJP92]